MLQEARSTVWECNVQCFHVPREVRRVGQPGGGGGGGGKL
jgi:hypothetical protein